MRYIPVMEITHRTESLALTAVRSLLEMDHRRGVRTESRNGFCYVFISGQNTMAPSLSGRSWNDILQTLMKQKVSV